jgi:hypothetical protein
MLAKMGRSELVQFMNRDPNFFSDEDIAAFQTMDEFVADIKRRAAICDGLNKLTKMGKIPPFCLYCEQRCDTLEGNPVPNNRVAKCCNKCRPA